MRETRKTAKFQVTNLNSEAPGCVEGHDFSRIHIAYFEKAGIIPEVGGTYLKVWTGVNGMRRFSIETL